MKVEEVLHWLERACEDLTLVGGQAVALWEHLLGLPVLTETVHSRSASAETLVRSVTRWNQGNWAAGCCPIRPLGHCWAKNFMYFRLRLEKPFISGKASRRSLAKRSMTLAPQP